MYVTVSIIADMVTFCLGSARQKRAYIKTVKDAVLLDNIEVLFCVSENGRNYFAYAPVPFFGFTVSDYLSYRRALCGKKLNSDDIIRFGLNPNKRMGKLSAGERRTVQFLEKTCGVTDKPVIVNLDGIRYGRRCGQALYRLIKAISTDVYVYITDPRFARKYSGKYETMTFGLQSKRRFHKFYYAKILAEKVGASKISVM